MRAWRHVGEGAQGHQGEDRSDPCEAQGAAEGEREGSGDQERGKASEARF